MDGHRARRPVEKVYSGRMRRYTIGAAFSAVSDAEYRAKGVTHGPAQALGPSAKSRSFPPSSKQAAGNSQNRRCAAGQRPAEDERPAGVAGSGAASAPVRAETSPDEERTAAKEGAPRPRAMGRCNATPERFEQRHFYPPEVC
ncbi:MAG: hypothetical protein IPL99_25725 [Candidatus Competibacteraceae bacterium]|nr:hypothetical protein [Candidatus Competibacteraceae bacterium]